MQTSFNKNQKFFDRLLQIIDYKGIKSVNEFALNYLNYDAPQKINRLKKENNKPSYDILIDIVNKFEDINPEWLLTGKGEMLKNSSTNEEIVSYNSKFIRNTNNKPVPFYDVDFIAGDGNSFDNQTITPEYYMDIPEFSGCTAFRAYSDSMEKLIKSGSILFGTKIENWFEHLEYGQIYGIISNDRRRYLKYIRKHQKNPEKYYILKSENPSYDDFEIPRKNIHSIWLVHGWLNRRT